MSYVYNSRVAYETMSNNTLASGDAIVSASSRPAPPSETASTNPHTALTLDDWDRLILEEFFAPSDKLRSVVVCVDEAVLERMAPGQGLHSLVQAVEDEAGELPTGDRNPLRLARQRLDGWMNTGRVGPPPLLGVLALLVAASDYGGQSFPPNSYWDRLEALRKTVAPAAEPANQSAQDLIEIVFRSLADWTAEKEQGRRGVFDLRRVGGMRRIGLVRAQALLSAGDRAAITSEFARRGVHPDASVSRGELVQLAQDAPGLRPVTRRILERWPSDPNAPTLVELVCDQLREWDGTIALPSGGRVRAKLWLSGVLELRAASGRQTAVLRVEGGRTDDLDGLEVRSEGTNTWSARFELGSLSEPLVDPDTNQLLDARRWDWSGEYRFGSADAEAPVAGVIVPGRRFRFFAPHEHKTFAERLSLPPSGPCLVACKATDAVAVADWARRHLPRACTELPSASIPDGWRLLRIDEVPENAEARGAFPGRGFVDAAVELLSLVGGECDDSGRYYPFTPPSIEVNTRREIRVRVLSTFDVHGAPCAGVRVEPIDDDARRLWRLVIPDELWSRVAGVRVEALDGSESVDLRTLHFSVLPSPVSFAEGTVDRWGRYAASPSEIPSRVPMPADEGEYDPAYPLGAPDPKSLEGLGSGDRLVQVLWAQRKLSWRSIKRIALELYRTTPDADDEWRFRRGLSFQLTALRALRHVAVAENASGHIEAVLARPPRLELLPVRAHSGLMSLRPSLRCPVQALATGCWRRRDLENLMSNARRARLGVHIAAQPAGYWLVPDRICIQAETIAEIATFASVERVEFRQRPAAVEASETLRSPREFLANASWQDGAPPSSGTSYVFDPTALEVRNPSTVAGDLVLFECHGAYAESRFTYWLHDRQSGRSVRVPRQLGRWIVRGLGPKGGQVLPLSSTGIVFTPLELRPPLAVEQAFCSCSGFAPEVYELPGVSSRALDDSLSLPASANAAVAWHGAQRVRSGYWLGYRGIATSRLRDERTHHLVGLDVELRRVSTLFASSLGRTTSAQSAPVR